MRANTFGLAASIVLFLAGPGWAEEKGPLFSAVDYPQPAWGEFTAAGFTRPACGVVYRLKDPVSNGLALGGVDTGCLDLETDGTLGYVTLFNSHVPRGREGILRLPLFALGVGGKTWALCGERPGHNRGLPSLGSWLPGDLGPAQKAWAQSAEGIPGWARSTGKNKFDLPAGRVFCHGPAVVQWLSPIGGSLEIQGGLWLTRNLGRVQKWVLRKNGIPLTSGQIAWGPTSAAKQDFAKGSGGRNALKLSVERGDILELLIDQVIGANDFVGVDLRLAEAGSGKTWDLAADWSDAQNPAGPWRYCGFEQQLPALIRPGQFLQVGRAKEIRYWGHYPVADVEFQIDGPVQAGLRAWSPFIPGQLHDSMMPGIVFETHLRNTSTQAQKGTLVFTFPGPSEEEAGGKCQQRPVGQDRLRGLEIRAPLVSYVLGALEEKQVRTGGELGVEQKAWTTIERSLPPALAESPGASVAVDFTLDGQQSKVVRFVLTWCAPTWKGGGRSSAKSSKTYTHVYARHYPDPAATAGLLAQRHAELLSRVLAWQQVVYSEKNLPVWLRDSLVNSLYMITEDGLWAQKGPVLPAWVRAEDGLFGLNESPRGCPQIECLPCSFYGSLPLVYFFPELQLSTMRAYKGYQHPGGSPPWIFGPNADMAAPVVHRFVVSPDGKSAQMTPAPPGYPNEYQAATNGISYAGIVDRFLLCRDESDKYLKEFYPSMKQCLLWTVGLRKTPSYSIGERILAMPDIDGHLFGLEWFEVDQPGWFGITAHVGILHLAHLRIVERMARQMGDEAFARQCADWTRAASEALDKHLWTGSYYRNFFCPARKLKSDLVFGYQLDGQWIMDHHGLASPIAADRVQRTLATIRRCNIALSKSAAVNYAQPDGTKAAVAGYGTYSYFPPEALMLAMTYMYNGQKEFGLELARRAWHNIVCKHGYTWDMPNIMRGDQDTGERVFGNDYYQDMILWSLPAALAGTDVSAPCKPGGLVSRILQAGQRAR